MTRLIRAEWYRLSHSSIFLPLIVFVSLLSLGMAPLNHGGSAEFFDASFDEALYSLTASLQLGLAMMITTLTAVACGMAYANRTAYYEIMDGNSVSSILMARLFVYVPMTIVSFLLPFFGLCAYIYVQNGTVEFADLPQFVIITTCIFLRMVTFCILSTMLFKSLLGAAMPYLRYMTIEMLGFEMALASCFDDKEMLKSIQGIYECLPMGQLMALGEQTIPDTLVIKAVVGLVVEFAIIYILAYISGKKKLFHK